MIHFFVGQAWSYRLLLRSTEGLLIPTHLRKHEEVLGLIVNMFLRLCEGWLDRVFGEPEVNLLTRKQELLGILINCSQLTQKHGGLFTQNLIRTWACDLLQNSWNFQSLTPNI